MKISFFKAFLASTLFSATASFALPKAAEIYPQMGLGYNIGNTMEVPSDPTAWGNIIPNEAIIKGIKDAGFGTVRIPCAWNSHATNGNIDTQWLATVKAVVDMCIKNGMYVMLNSHWDEGWLEDNVFSGNHTDRDGNPSSTDSAAVRKLQESYWLQIANYFKDYDEHLMFASANEPGVNDHRGSGAQYTDNGQLAFKADRMAILKSLHEACLRSVRSSGGNNATRTVIVQMPRTEYEKANLLVDQYPVDPAGEGYTMAEFHWYPYQLAFMPSDESWGKVFYYWEDVTTGNDNEHTCSGSSLGSKSSTESVFSKMQTMFVDQGIPVVIGEMGIARHFTLSGANFDKHMEARAAWYGYTVATAKKHGLVPVVWDTGYEGNDPTNFSNFTLIRRQAQYGNDLGSVVDKPVMDAMVKQFAETKFEGAKTPVVITEDDKALWVEYKTKTDKKSETGTIRFDFKGGTDWSTYNAISFQIRGEGEALPCFDDEENGCNGYAWTSLDLFAMSTKSSTWTDYHVGSVENYNGALNTVKVKLGNSENDSDALNFADKSMVTAFGINIYATQFTGTIYLDNILLHKADGTVDTLESFSVKPSNMKASGTAVSATIIPANAKGTNPNAVPPSAIKPIRNLANTLVRNGDMLISNKAIQLFDLNGKLIRTANEGASTTMSLEGIHQGLYIAKSGANMLKVILK